MTKKITVELHEEDGKWYVPYDELRVGKIYSQFFYQGKLVYRVKHGGSGFLTSDDLLVTLTGLKGRVEFATVEQLFPKEDK